MFGIMKAIDALPVHLCERFGVSKIPLAYVIRGNVRPITLDVLESERITSSQFTSIIDEMILAVPHTGPNYTEDNAKVFQIILDIVSGSSHEASIKVHRMSRDGRGVYLSLHMHNMGSSKWDRIIDDCETYLLRREWNGRNYRFTLKSHIAKHRKAHNELTRASDFVKYELPNEHTRVSRLIKSLTSKDPAIVAAITHIQGDTVRRNDFEQAADFLLLNAPAPKEMEANYRISALGVVDHDGVNKSGKDVGKTGIELRYYKRDEYNRLNKAQNSELHEWRKNMKRGNDKGKKGNDDESKIRISALETQIQQLLELNKNMSKKILAVSTANNNTNNNNVRNPLTCPLNQRMNE